jgi:hypothetical protein
MSPIRALLAMFVVAFALSTVACASATAPRGCDVQNSNTCH